MLAQGWTSEKGVTAESAKCAKPIHDVHEHCHQQETSTVIMTATPRDDEYQDEMTKQGRLDISSEHHGTEASETRFIMELKPQKPRFTW